MSNTASTSTADQDGQADDTASDREASADAHDRRQNRTSDDGAGLGLRQRVRAVGVGDCRLQLMSAGQEGV